MNASTNKLFSFLCAMLQQIAQEKNQVSDAQKKLVFDAIEEYNSNIKEDK